MTRQFRREKLGKNENIYGKIRHCVVCTIHNSLCFLGVAKGPLGGQFLPGFKGQSSKNVLFSTIQSAISPWTMNIKIFSFLVLSLIWVSPIEAGVRCTLGGDTGCSAGCALLGQTSGICDDEGNRFYVPRVAIFAA